MMLPPDLISLGGLDFFILLLLLFGWLVLSQHKNLFLYMESYRHRKHNCSSRIHIQVLLTGVHFADEPAHCPITS